MKSTADVRDADMSTTWPDCVQQQEVEHHEQAAETAAVVISRDLRDAIDLLRAVPSARVTVRHRSHKERHDADRRPLRPVNQHPHRLSLPAQLHQHTDHLAVRQCSSVTDDVVDMTGALAVTSISANNNKKLTRR